MTWQTIKALHRVVIFSLLAATYLLTYWTRRIRDWLPLLHFAYRTFQPLLLLEHSTICNKHRAGPAHILFWTCQHGTLVRVSQLWGTGVWLISMCLIFWCWVFKEMRLSIQQEGIPSSHRHQQHPEYYTHNVRNGGWGTSVEMMPEWPAAKVRPLPWISE